MHIKQYHNHKPCVFKQIGCAYRWKGSLFCSIRQIVVLQYSACCNLLCITRWSLRTYNMQKVQHYIAIIGHTRYYKVRIVLQFTMHSISSINIEKTISAYNNCFESSKWIIAWRIILSVCQLKKKNECCNNCSLLEL